MQTRISSIDRLISLSKASTVTCVLASLVFATWLAMPRTAHAHAALMKSDPAANGVLPAGPHSVILLFNSRVDAPHSSLTLLRGEKPEPLAIETKAASNILRALTGTLQPGHYRLRWQAVASDGHISRGEIPFDVK